MREQVVRVGWHCACGGSWTGSIASELLDELRQVWEQLHSGAAHAPTSIPTIHIASRNPSRRTPAATMSDKGVRMSANKTQCCNRCGRAYLFSKRGVLDMEGKEALAGEYVPPLPVQQVRENLEAPRCAKCGSPLIVGETLHTEDEHLVWMERQWAMQRNGVAAYHILAQLASVLPTWNDAEVAEWVRALQPEMTAYFDVIHAPTISEVRRAQEA